MMRRVMLTTIAGLIVALLCSTFVVIRHFVYRADQDLLRLASLYLVLGLTAGALVGLVLPLAKSGPGAFLVGAIGGAYIMAVAGFTLSQVSERDWLLPWFAGFGAAGGGVAGVVLRAYARQLGTPWK